MPAPKRPNTAAATFAVVHRGHETMAKKLRAAGWVVVAPENEQQIKGCPDCEWPTFIRL